MIAFVSRLEKNKLEREREKERCIEIRPEKSSSKYIRRPSIVDNPTRPDSGVVALDRAWRWGWRWEETGEEEDQGWTTKGGLIRGHRIGCSNLLVVTAIFLSHLFPSSSVLGPLLRSSGIYILFWSESYIGRSFVDSLHYDQDDNGNDNDSPPPTVPGRP